MHIIEPKQVPAHAQIVDVREPAEWAEGHAAGAIHIPLGELPARIDELDADRDIFFICHSGVRSARAAEYVEKTRGWEATNIRGGTEEWAAEGLPLEVPSD